MSTTTTYLSLVKPATTDVVDITVLNANADTLDTVAKSDQLVKARARPATSPLVGAGTMTSAPGLTLAKGGGATISAVAAGGTGHAVNDEITLTGGTFPTVVKVTAHSGGVITAASVITPGSYTSNPTNPVAQASSTGSGINATFNLTMNAGVACSVKNATQYGATNAVFRFTGLGPDNIGGSGFYGNIANYNGTACAWEWCTDSALLDIRLLGNNIRGLLFVNGQRVDTVGTTTDASGAGYIYQVDWSGVVLPRTYRLVQVNSCFGGINVAGTSTAWKSTGTRRPLAWGLGDSYMYGTGAGNVASAAFDTMCELSGLEPLPDGIGGTGWLSSGSSIPATRATTKLSGLTYHPDYVFLDLGYNDAGGDMGALATSFNNTVAAVQANAPTAKIIVFGPATPVGSSANLTYVKNAVSACCTALGLPFIDVDNWVSLANKSVYTGNDNTHPTQAGHDYIGARKAQAVSSYL